VSKKIPLGTEKTYGAELLFQGAFFALEQAGQLLNDAALLFENRRWASAAVLSVFSLEELGKSDILIDQTKRSLAGHSVTCSMLKNTFEKHEAKLKRGRSRDTIISGRAFIVDTETLEFEAHEKETATEGHRELKRAPSKMHAQRKASLYVTLTPEQDWSRPKSTQPRDAYSLISSTVVEYGKRRGKFVRREYPALKQLFERYERWLQALPEPASIRVPDPVGS